MEQKNEYEEIEELKEKIEELQRYNNELTNELEKLKLDFSENTIIESMNDMKILYENVRYGNQKMKKITNEIFDNLISCQSVIKIILKNYVENHLNYGLYGNNIDTIRHYINLLNELIEESLKKRTEFYLIY